MTNVVNWTAVFNRLMSLMDQPGPSYFSGPRFIRAIQEIDPYLEDYGLYMEMRKVMERSTSRRDYFRGARGARDLRRSIEPGLTARVVDGELLRRPASQVPNQCGAFAADQTSWTEEMTASGRSN